MECNFQFFIAFLPTLAAVWCKTLCFFISLHIFNWFVCIRAGTAGEESSMCTAMAICAFCVGAVWKFNLSWNFRRELLLHSGRAVSAREMLCLETQLVIVLKRSSQSKQDMIFRWKLWWERRRRWWEILINFNEEDCHNKYCNEKEKRESERIKTTTVKSHKWSGKITNFNFQFSTRRVLQQSSERLVECSEFRPSPEESTVSEALAVEFETIYVTFFLLSSWK